MKIVFFGAGKYVIPIVEVLNNHFELETVFTTEKDLDQDLIAFCIKNKIPYASVSSKEELLRIVNSKLSIINTQLAVLANFGLIIPKEILDSFPKGIINVHPSFLPKYRGPTPGQTAILNGDLETGVSIIKLDEKVDHGHILVQKKEQILPNDTSETLYPRLFNIGAKLIEENITKYIKGQIKLSEQNHSKATFTKLLTKESGYFDLNNHPSEEKLNLMVRAYYPWPGVWTRSMINGKSSIIKFLPQEKIQVEGKKPMSYKDFINGYPESELVQFLQRGGN